MVLFEDEQQSALFKKAYKKALKHNFYSNNGLQPDATPEQRAYQKMRLDGKIDFILSDSRARLARGKRDGPESFGWGLGELISTLDSQFMEILGNRSLVNMVVTIIESLKSLEGFDMEIIRKRFRKIKRKTPTASFHKKYLVRKFLEESLQILDDAIFG